MQETHHWHEDTGATSAGQPEIDVGESNLLPVEPPLELIAELRAALSEALATRRLRLKDAWGFIDLEFQGVVNSNSLVELVETIDRVPPRCTSQ